MTTCRVVDRVACEFGRQLIGKNRDCSVIDKRALPTKHLQASSVSPTCANGYVTRGHRKKWCLPELRPPRRWPLTRHLPRGVFWPARPRHPDRRRADLRSLLLKRRNEKREGRVGMLGRVFPPKRGLIAPFPQSRQRRAHEHPERGRLVQKHQA